MVKDKKVLTYPNAAQLEAEIAYERSRKRKHRMFKSSVSILLVTAALAVLLTQLWCPVLQIHGSSMSPTLRENDVVMAVKTNSYEIGDIIAFYSNNKLLIKRCIAKANDWVEILDDGTVLVNDAVLEEAYVSELDKGITDLTYPYVVPKACVFVMGDNREDSLDSRIAEIGCIQENQIVGKVLFRIWPLSAVSYY